MSTSNGTNSKKVKLDAAVNEQRIEPVAGPSSERLDHAQSAGEEGVEDVTKEGEDDEHNAGDDDDDDDEDDDENEDDFSVSEGELSDEEEEDDYEDIVQANEAGQAGHKKKRKRALPSQAFGSMLSSLIAAPAPTKPLRPLHPPASEEALEKRAAKALHAQKHEREERGHVKDVIAGWTARPNLPFSQWHGVDTYEDGEDKANVEHAAGGAEKEKELRRLAQRGVVRLFNAIKAAQYTEEAATANPAIATSTSASRAIKDASPAPSATGSITAGPVSRAGNMLGSRGRQEALANLSKASFLDLFKSGAAPKKLPA